MISKKRIYERSLLPIFFNNRVRNTSSYHTVDARADSSPTSLKAMIIIKRLVICLTLLPLFARHNATNYHPKQQKQQNNASLKS